MYRHRRLSTTPNLFVNKLNDVSVARIANATKKPPVSQELCTIVGEKEPLTSKGIICSEIVSVSTYILELSLYPAREICNIIPRPVMYNINKNIAVHIIDHHKCMPSSIKGHEVCVELKQETWKSKNVHRGDDVQGQGPSAGCRNNSQHGGARKKGRYYIVTHLAWIAAKLVSSNSETRYALAAS